jgi:uncharacterized protein YsxB (DUF464 family)
MIRAKYSTDGESHSLVMAGHAGYADKGDDIVCSAVSSLIYALLGWLENNPEDLEWSNASVDSGDVHIVCFGGERTSAVFDMTAIGLEQIAMKYPDCLEIEIAGIAG